MEKFITLLFCLLNLIIISDIYAQDSLQTNIRFPEGISLGYGIGNFAVIDEYISKEKYSCTLPFYNVEWVRFNDKNAYRMEIEYRYSNNITNNNISAKGGQFVFNQDIIYPIGNFPLFSRNVYAYMGPSVQLFFYDFYYHFVIPGTFISPETSGTIGSLGINTQFVYPVNNKLGVEGFLRSNLLSFSGKQYDEQEYENEPGPVLLSVFTATKLDFELSARYYVVNNVSMSLGYKFDLSRIHKWDLYIAASNSLVISLNYKF
ncbi:hypothetical protein ACFLU5_01680 [Bacteroidota bacterium]